MLYLKKILLRLERTRHSHLEKVARLERDLGELDREVVKLRADLESSESVSLLLTEFMDCFFFCHHYPIIIPSSLDKGKTT